MIDRFKNYCTRLEALTDRELDRSAEKLVVGENTSIAKLIAHLAEMSERKTALRLGYSSLYDYCARRLNLSEGAVPARVHVANVCRRFPELLAALAERRISLTVAGLLAAHVTEENVETLIDACAGKTRKETELYLVSLKPKPVFQPSIRKLPVSPARKSSEDVTPETSGGSAPPAILPSPEPEPEPAKASSTIVQPAAEVERAGETTTVFNFRFSADRDFKDKLERLAEVLGVANSERNMAAIMERAIDIALDKKDPKRRLERRTKRKEARAATAGGGAGAERSRSNEVGAAKPETVTRHVPADRRDRVHANGGYQCEYRGPDGTRCASRIVEVDHMKPFARSPNHEEQAMRLLCKRHNQLEAERVYGAAFIQRRIQERTSNQGLRL